MPRGASFLNLCFRFIHQFATLFLHLLSFIETICIYVQHGLCLCEILCKLPLPTTNKIFMHFDIELFSYFEICYVFLFLVEFFVHFQYFTVLLMSQDGCLVRPSVSVQPFLAILPSHGKKNKGSYSQPSSPQCPKRAK